MAQATKKIQLTKLVQSQNNKTIRAMNAGLILAAIAALFSLSYFMQLDIWGYGILFTVPIVTVIFLYVVYSLSSKENPFPIIGVVACALVVLAGFMSNNYTFVNSTPGILQVLGVLTAMIIIGAFVMNYKSLLLPNEQKVQYGILTAIAIFGSLISFGCVIFLAIIMLSARACDLSGSSKCL